MAPPPAAKPQPIFWRSLDEWAETEEFLEHLQREFPQHADDWLAHRPNRREFLRLMAASLALSGWVGCAKPPEEHIVPTTTIPEIPPGSGTRYYATAMPWTGGGLGLLVASYDGRPIKVEGNPEHPQSLGATDAFAQASLLDLYDPDRSQVVKHQNQISSWNTFVSAMKGRLAAHKGQNGAGLRILSSPILSPTLLRQKVELLKAFPEARWHIDEPINADAARAGASLAFDQDVRPIYRFENADVVLSIEGDFLGQGAGKLAYARRFAERRRVDSQQNPKGMNRLYAIECTPTLTGAVADHRWPLAPSAIESFVLRLAAQLGVAGIEAPDSVPAFSEGDWNALVSDLNDSSRQRLVVVGEYQPAWVQALGHAINARLGAVGQSVVYVAPLTESPLPEDSLAGLVKDMTSGGDAVETLLILESNPALTAPADFAFARLLEQVPVSVHFGLHLDETAVRSTWHVPAAHFLESWSDVRAFDGTVSLVQPLIAPMYNAKTLHELMNVLLDQPQKPAHESVRETWRMQHGEENFEPFWQQALHDGVIPDTRFDAVEPALRGSLAEQIAQQRAEGTTSSDQNVTVAFRPHPTLWDGRFANNGWLQELPQPFTKLTWGNAALISRATANEHELRDGDVIELSHADRSVWIAVLIVPGQADGVITLHLGAGRSEVGRVGKAVGTDVFPLRTSDAMWTLENVTLSKSGEHRDLSRTQHHFLIEGRDLVRQGTFAEYQADSEHPPFMSKGHHAASDASFYPDLLEGSPQWGMSINLSACVGCSACVVACQAENNIPVVGPIEVARGREMHWLRIDTYYEGEPENPKTYHQPMLCMHCEHAPCEVVCPVAATTHSSDGLNEMTYNRCIGTRYCSNNCPYKVRRFNYFDYQEPAREFPVLQLLQNPEVTVRSRGVMEKCTYCVQRISKARIQAGMENRDIADGELVTA
jgi:molybdopterin-containing oxidoreductase family iron-sulfur binding subunit